MQVYTHTQLTARVIISVFWIVFFTTDINPFACQITRQTGIQNEIKLIEPIQTSLVQGLLPRLKNSIDILCFNPPYVVTTHEEVGSMGIEASWAGGIDGREVIDELLPFIKVTYIHCITDIFCLIPLRTYYHLKEYSIYCWLMKISLMT